MNNILCPICHSDKTKYIDSVDTINPDNIEKVDLIRCNNCSHLFHCPIPSQTELISMYKNVNPNVTTGIEFGNDIKIESSKIYKLIDKLCLKENANYLEIGIGSGNLFKAMQKKFNCIGIEPGYKGDGNNIISSIDEIKDDLKFDIIVCQDVLEHIADPVEYLNILNKLASANALIFCTFPNADSLLSKIRGSKWRMIRPFGHLHYFSRISANILFKNTGWEISKVLKIFAGEGPMSFIRKFNLKEFLIEIIFGRDQFLIIGKKIK